MIVICNATKKIQISSKSFCFYGNFFRVPFRSKIQVKAEVSTIVATLLLHMADCVFKLSF